MAHFAQVKNGIVQQVIVAEQDFIDEMPDKEDWIQTSYNTRGGVHYAPNSWEPDDGVALRGNYASAGDTYDAEHDVFYKPQPFPSWIISGPTWIWEPPVPYPNDDNQYVWNEELTKWELVGANE